MEEWERKIILQNLDSLVNETMCSFELLSKLVAAGVLSEEDAQMLVNFMLPP